MAIEQTATTVKIVREIAATETRMTRSLGWDSTTAAPVVAFGVEIDYCGTDYEVNSNPEQRPPRLHPHQPQRRQIEVPKHPRVPPGTPHSPGASRRKHRHPGGAATD